MTLKEQLHAIISRQAIEAHGDLLNPAVTRAGMRSAVRDVLTDILHICDMEDLHFSEISHSAYEVYDHEQFLAGIDK